jgi:hypothetical protein
LTKPHPPHPRLTLNIGITGHRASVLPEGMLDEVRASIHDVLEELAEATRWLHAHEPHMFTSDAPRLRLHTALATGSDQLAALAGRELGYAVRAPLPFTPEEYARDFADGAEAAAFQQHLQTADEVFALPGTRELQDDAYVLVGRAVIVASDILVAVWDGGEGNGRGGTAHVVNLALRAGVPVLHVGIDRASKRVMPVRLLVGGDVLEPEVERIEGAESYRELVADTLAPHAKFEREHIADYFTEVETRTNWRLEYPILLSLLGVKKLPKRPWRQMTVAQSQDLPKDFEGADHAAFLNSYAWANFLAIRYAQLFRSGHVTNYALSALAVLIALSGLLVPAIKVYLVAVELAVIGLLFYNTWLGQKGDWHRRWLQYRHLAESLRPMIYLKNTGVAAPPFRSDFVRGSHNREAGSDWTRWYAAAVWRELSCAVGIMTHDKIKTLADRMLTEQIEPQTAYHQVNARRMRKLDHKLHEVGNVLMWMVIASCVVFLVGYVVAYEWIHHNVYYFVVLTAGLPACSAAIFGLRGHGEHLLAASRSNQTANALATHGDKLAQANDLDELAAEFESTASVMLADLNEWVVAYRERSLQIPG